MLAYSCGTEDAYPVVAGELSTLPTRQFSKWAQVKPPSYLSSQLSGRILADPTSPSIPFSAIK